MYPHAIKIIGVIMAFMTVIGAFLIKQIEIENAEKIIKYLYWIFCFALMLIIYSKERSEDENIKNWRLKCFMLCFLILITSMLAFNFVEIITHSELHLNILLVISINELFYLLVYNIVAAIKANSNAEKFVSFKANKKSFYRLILISCILLIGMFFIFG